MMFGTWQGLPLPASPSDVPYSKESILKLDGERGRACPPGNVELDRRFDWDGEYCRSIDIPITQLCCRGCYEYCLCNLACLET